MSDLKAQKRLAADELDVGKGRVWLDPEAQEEVADAITREDIRELIDRERSARRTRRRTPAVGPASAPRSARTATRAAPGPGKGRPARDRTPKTTGRHASAHSGPA